MEFGFSGEQNDPNALEYLRARYYDPAIGRFVSEDGWPASAFDPRTLNRYLYALANPTNLVDPSGAHGQTTLIQSLCDQFSGSGCIGGNGGGGALGGIRIAGIGGAVAGGLGIAGAIIFASETADGDLADATGDGAADYLPGETDVVPPTPSTDAQAVIEAVRNNQPSPFNLPNNGGTFHNDQGLLPAEPDGYYTEYGVPGDTADRQERVVKGLNGEIYYTPNHYEGFYVQ